MSRIRRWRRVAMGPLEALAANLGPGVQGDRDALHAARVASRRSRALVAILRRGLGNRRCRKLLRRLRRITSFLGRVRELDVSLSLIDALTSDGSPLDPRVRAVRTALEAERKEALRAAADRARPETASRLRDKLSAKLEELERERFDWDRAAGDELELRARDLLAAVNRARVFYDADRLHRARVALKRFRYVVELASAARAMPAKRPLAVLRRAQDLLGRMHDLDVLTHRLRAAAGGHAEKVAARFETEARSVHAEYVALRPRLTEVIKECRERFGTAEAVTRRGSEPGRRRAVARMASARNSRGRVA